MESLERQNLNFIHLQEGRGGLLPHAYKMSYKFCYIFPIYLHPQGGLILFRWCYVDSDFLSFSEQKFVTIWAP